MLNKRPGLFSFFELIEKMCEVKKLHTLDFKVVAIKRKAIKIKAEGRFWRRSCSIKLVMLSFCKGYNDMKFKDMGEAFGFSESEVQQLTQCIFMKIGQDNNLRKEIIEVRRRLYLSRLYTWLQPLQ